MYGIRTLAIAAVAVCAAAEAVHGGQLGGGTWAPDLAPRGVVCQELPQLCTGAVMMHGEATTLTYLCPEKTQGPSTVHVTVTATTTVTVAPTTSAPVAPTIGAPTLPPKNTPTTDEPTTTTTIKSTLTQYKTITVISKHRTSSVLNLTPPVITTSFSQGAPPSLSSSLTMTLPLANGTANSTVNGTVSSVFSTHSTCNSSTVATTPLYPNITSHSGYGTPTFNLAREARATSTALALNKSTSDQTEVSFVALFIGLMAAAYFV